MGSGFCMEFLSTARAATNTAVGLPYSSGPQLSCNLSKTRRATASILTEEVHIIFLPHAAKVQLSLIRKRNETDSWNKNFL